MEDMGNEAAQKAELKSAKETAERLIKKGKMTLEVRSVSPYSLRVTASEHIGTEIYMLYFFAIKEEHGRLTFRPIVLYPFH